MDIRKATLKFNALGQDLQLYAAGMSEDEPSNCLLAALRLRALRGGVLRMQPSRYGDWEHVQLELPNGEIWEYQPTEPKFHQDIPPTLFVGEMVRVGISHYLLDNGV